MTEDQANKKMVLSSRVTKITKDRLDLLASIYECSPGEMVDRLVALAYDNAQKQGKIAAFLNNLDHVEPDTSKVLE